jgi:serine/threonine protein kinase
VDVYSFSMILYQLFEHQPPFAGTDPVEAARQAALYEYRPPLSQLKGRLEPFPVRQEEECTRTQANSCSIVAGTSARALLKCWRRCRLASSVVHGRACVRCLRWIMLCGCLLVLLGELCQQPEIAVVRTSIAFALQTLKALIEKCWHPNPERRPSFLLIINELSQLLDNMPRKVSSDMQSKRSMHYVNSGAYGL